jgi:hypothetical protein
MLVKSGNVIQKVNFTLDSTEDDIEFVMKSYMEQQPMDVLQWVVESKGRVVLMSCMSLYEMSEKIHRLELNNG